MRRLAGRRSEQNRVVAVVDGLDADAVLHAAASGVVAGELAEGALGHLVVGVDVALERNLGVCRDGQAGDAPPYDRHALSDYRTRPLVFAHAVGRVRRSHGKEQRMPAGHEHDRAGLAAVPVLFDDARAVVRGRDVGGDGVPVVHHRAVGAEVDPAGVRVGVDVDAAGADVAPAVVRVPERDRKARDIHVVAFKVVFKYRPVVDIFHGEVLRAPGDLLHDAGDGAQHGEVVALCVNAERRAEGRRVEHRAAQDAIARGIALEAAEEQRRALPLAVELRECADLGVERRAVDGFELTGGVYFGEKCSQIEGIFHIIHLFSPPRPPRAGISASAARIAAAPCRRCGLSARRGCGPRYKRSASAAR